MKRCTVCSLAAHMIELHTVEANGRVVFRLQSLCLLLAKKRNDAQASSRLVLRLIHRRS